jgi:hypothetical protein
MCNGNLKYYIMGDGAIEISQGVDDEKGWVMR